MPETAGRYAQKQQSFKESVTAHPSRSHALKMDGTKSITDTAGHRNVCGRQVFCRGRSTFESMCGPCGIMNLGGSRN